MTECLKQEERKAIKQHVCNYCNCIIEKGEKYNYGKYKCDDDFFEWKTHKRCDFIATELWDIVDPEEGMSEEDFFEACGSFCNVFVCPDCPQFDKEYGECDEDRGYCLHKIYDKLQTHRLAWDRNKFGMMCFKIVPREKESAV